MYPEYENVIEVKLTKDEWDGLSEALASEYTLQGDGNYTLNLPDGVVSKSRVDEFRNNNITLKKQLEEFQKRQLQIDNMVAKDDYDALKAELQSRLDKEQIDKGNIEEVVKDRMSRAQSEFTERQAILQRDLEDKQSKFEKLHSDFQNSEIQAKLVTELNRVGKIRTGAENDLLERARKVWRLNENNSLVAFKQDGTEMFGANAEPITVSEYCSDQLTDAAHCYEGASGTDAKGDGDSSPKKPAGIIPSDMGDVADILDDLGSGKVVMS